MFCFDLGPPRQIPHNLSRSLCNPIWERLIPPELNKANIYGAFSAPWARSLHSIYSNIARWAQGANFFLYHSFSFSSPFFYFIPFGFFSAVRGAWFMRRRARVMRRRVCRNAKCLQRLFRIANHRENTIKIFFQNFWFLKKNLFNNYSRNTNKNSYFVNKLLSR